MKERAGETISYSESEHDIRVPLAIRELGPCHIFITSEQVTVELHGGFEHYGFIAYAEGVDSDDPHNELIDGLHFYSF